MTMDPVSHDFGGRPKSARSPFRFVDAFAGIGGFRIGLRRAGGRCAYSIERDTFARTAYLANFGHEPDVADITPYADVLEAGLARMPQFHLLAAGFPCQPFSIAGVSKKLSLGRKHGFEEATQGTLFFELARIVAASTPPILLLENVKNLLYHDRGRTLKIIQGTVQELGYSFSPNLIDARYWVPQHRERVFMICLRRDMFGSEPYVMSPLPNVRPRSKRLFGGVIRNDGAPLHRYVLTEALWQYLQEYRERHRSAGHGFGFGLVDRSNPDVTTRTLSARYYKDGSEILVATPSGRPRRLTPRECARLMGFDERFKIVVSDQQAYKQFGNAVVPPVVTWVARDLIAQGIIQAAVARDPTLASHRRSGPRQLELPVPA